MKKSFLALLLIGTPLFGKTPETGILLMAHGGDPQWNKEVQDVATQVDQSVPTEVAFGMADRDTLQLGITKLQQRGVKRIVAVPLFISSHSSVIESIKYLLGLRPDAPKDLALFASMHHPMADHPVPMSNHLVGHPIPEPIEDPPMADMHHTMNRPLDMSLAPIPSPVKASVPIQMSEALNHHPIVADILADRAAAITKDPAREALILVAHGPNEDKENAEWLSDMAILAKRLSSKTSYARVVTVTVRDDAEPAVREKATADLRQDAQSAKEAGYRVLIVPLLLSYGGIENGLRQRLDGIDHVFSPHALLPDPRIAQWVLDSATTMNDVSKANK